MRLLRGIVLTITCSPMPKIACPLRWSIMPTSLLMPSVSLTRTVMGDADLVKASGGTVTVDGSDALQGLSFFVAEKDGQVISSYAIEDTAAELMSTSTSDALASLNVAGVSSITLVDANVSDLANASDGASLNAIADGLTNGATMSFLVEDSATNLAANALNLNLADDVSVGTDGQRLDRF